MRNQGFKIYNALRVAGKFVTTIHCPVRHHACLDCLKGDVYGKPCGYCNGPVYGINVPQEKSARLANHFVDQDPNYILQHNLRCKEINAIAKALETRDNYERPGHFIARNSITIGMIVVVPVLVVAATVFTTAVIVAAPFVALTYGAVRLLDKRDYVDATPPKKNEVKIL